MKLLLDQGTPRSAVTILRRAGFDAVHTGEIGLAEADDSEIIRQAAEQGRIVVTLDADFHAQLALTQAQSPSVIRIRVEGLRGDSFCALLQNVLRQCIDDLQAGAMISVNEVQIRIRRLPVA
jgi:predicted nuclease of predicted toxin-antitoxin system